MTGKPSRKRIEGVVCEAFVDVVGTLPPNGLRTSPQDVADWSSLAQVRLVHAVERELGCELDEELLAVGPSLGSLAEYAYRAVHRQDGR